MLPASTPCHQSSSSCGGGGGGGAARRFFPVRRPGIRVSSEFDSDSSLFFHKVSCKLFDGLAKLKLSFKNDRKGRVECPQLAFLTKHISFLHDFDLQKSVLKGSFDLAKFLQVRATHDVKVAVLHDIRVCLSAEPFSVSCNYENGKSIVSRINFGSWLFFNYHDQKEQQREVTFVTRLGGDPTYKLELSSSFPSIELRRAKVQFPHGEVSVQEKNDEIAQRVLCINGVLKGHLLDGVCAASYCENALNLRYCYKDEEMSFTPSLTLPMKVLSFSFKRRFSPSDKLSYWYHFYFSKWSAVYKHTVGKDFKLKAGYDSGMRLGWASLWVGDEDGKAKTAPMKMKVHLMVQVPQYDIRSPVFLFRVKKRWDL